MTGPRFLVTGGTGFVGRHVTRTLVRSGADVHVASRHSRYKLAARWHQVDLLAGDGPSLVDTVRPDVLVHLAWVTDHDRFWESPDNANWVAVSLGLVRRFLESGGRRILLASTCMDEASTPYSAAKAALTAETARLAERHGARLAVARLFYMYGPHEHPQRLVPSVSRALLEGVPAETSSGRVIRDFLHVHDVGAAVASIATTPVEGVVDVGSGEPVAVRDVVRILGDLAGRPDLLRIGAREDRGGEPPNLVANAHTLRRVVGYSPQIPLKEGLRQTLEWWRLRSEQTVTDDMS